MKLAELVKGVPSMSVARCYVQDGASLMQVLYSGDNYRDDYGNDYTDADLLSMKVLDVRGQNGIEVVLRQ